MQRRFMVIFSLVILLLGVMLPAPTAHADDPTNPDFSQVTDILQGRRTLYPVDDIVVAYKGAFAPAVSTILQTTNDNVSAQIPHPVTADLQQMFSLSLPARMFNLPRDVIVTVLDGETNLYDQLGSYNQSFPNAVGGSLAFDLAVVTDLTGDSFSDVAFLAGHNLYTLTAADVNDPTQGFFYGTVLDLGNYADQSALTAGDFDGDGVNELAVALPQDSNTPIQIYRPQVTTNAQGNVTALTLQQVGTTVLPDCCDGEYIALSAGRYLGILSEQLVAVYGVGNKTTVQPFTIAPAANPPQVTIQPAAPLVLNQDGSGGIAAQSGLLDFFGASEQVVLQLQGTGGPVLLDVLTFDSALNATMASSLTTAYGVGFDDSIALGNFDQPQVSDGTLALEIAAVFPANTAQCTGHNVALMVQIFHVDPSNQFALSQGNSAQVGSDCFDTSNFELIQRSIATGDLQERSLALGAPSKLTVTLYQPTLILGAPPMHLDYALPANASKATVLNLSAVPHGFYSKYQTSVSNKTQSARQNTTSYSNAGKVSGTFGFKIGDALVGSVTVQAGASAGLMHKHYIQKQYSSYSAVSFDASTSTGFDDQVWFNEEDHNIFIYPVIGKTVCPGDNDNCAPSERVPLLVMFSGPDETFAESAGGSVIEWYQPVQEIGNVFSYPWNYAQMELAHANLDPLSPTDPTGFSTDSTTYVAQTTWSGQNSNSVTSGSTTNISWGASVSMSEKPSIFGGIVGNQKFSYNGSKAINNINSNTTTVGASTGIGINKPGSFPNPDLYQYPVFPYIFGNNPVSGTLQAIDLGTTVTTTGILRTLYTTDPTLNTAGGWWQQTYTQPDLALAHPSRWSFQTYTPSAPEPNCIPIAPQVRNNDCATFNPPDPSDIWLSEFHYMKGLLITPADSNGEGPQLDSATAGDQIRLQARVYNNSFVDMPSDSEIVVQFYAQPMDPTNKVPVGNSVLIDSVPAAPLPGFNSITNSGTSPNWELVETTALDTTQFSNQFVAFWILVYMRDAQGNLVPEMPSHGLKAVPPTLTDISAATPYLQSYSNNIGLYKSLFFIEGQNSSQPISPTQADMTLSHVQTSKSTVLLGDKIVVSGQVRAQTDVRGLAVLFYDGAPSQKGTLFDIEHIARLRAGEPQIVKTLYRPQACGIHDLYIRVPSASLTKHTQINVTIDPLKYTRRLARVLKTLDLPKGRAGGGFLPLLRQAQKAFKNNDVDAGLSALRQFEERVKAQRGNKIPDEQADTMLSILGEIFACLP